MKAFLTTIPSQDASETSYENIDDQIKPAFPCHVDESKPEPSHCLSKQKTQDKMILVTLNLLFFLPVFVWGI